MVTALSVTVGLLAVAVVLFELAVRRRDRYIRSLEHMLLNLVFDDYVAHLRSDSGVRSEEEVLGDDGQQ